MICTVRDLSITGAALEVPTQSGIPAKFTSVEPGDGLSLPCNVVWRSGYRIGVAFDLAASVGEVFHVSLDHGASAPARPTGWPNLELKPPQ